MKKKKARSEETFGISADERAGRDTAIGDTQPALQRYITPDAGGMTPFRRALLQTRQEGFRASSDNLRSKLRQKANMAGFGHATPFAQGADTELEGRLSAEEGRIPAEVELDATAPEFEALGMRSDQAKIYNPDYYYGSGVQQEEAARERKGKLWRALIGAGGSIASAGMA